MALRSLLHLVTFQLSNIPLPRVGAQVAFNGQQFVIDLATAAGGKLGKPDELDMIKFLRGGSDFLRIARDVTRDSSCPYRFRLEDVNLKAPVKNPEKIICVGLNYKDHAEESNLPLPTVPVLFSKYANTIIGPGDIIEHPIETKELDYEVELVAVIGREGRRIPPEKALDYVAGYTVGHDVSARDWQLKMPGGQWMAGKTFDTFAPIGPSIVVHRIPGEKDEEDAFSFDPLNLKIKCTLNDQVVQNSSTNQLVFHIDHLVSHISKLVTLRPGDLIFTGTPPGVGFARKPPLWMKVGDRVTCEIEHLGKLSNTVGPSSSSS